MSTVPVDDATHERAVRMLRWLARQQVDDQGDRPEPASSIDYRARALERSPIALTACEVIASLGADSLEPQFELRDPIDSDLPISLHLSLVKGGARVTFPANRKRIIKCDVFDREPLTFTLRQGKTENTAFLTPEQMALLARVLRLPPRYQHFADERLAPTGIAALKQLARGALTWAQAELMGRLIALKETTQKGLCTQWQLVEKVLFVDLHPPLPATRRQGRGPASTNYAQEFTTQQDLLIYVPAPDGPNRALGTLWREPPTIPPQVTLQIDRGDPQTLPVVWNKDWRQFTLPSDLDQFSPEGQLSWTWRRDQNTLALRWETIPTEE